MKFLRGYWKNFTKISNRRWRDSKDLTQKCILGHIFGIEGLIISIWVKWVFHWYRLFGQQKKKIQDATGPCVRSVSILCQYCVIMITRFRWQLRILIFIIFLLNNHVYKNDSLSEHFWSWKVANFLTQFSNWGVAIFLEGKRLILESLWVVM